MSREAKGQIWLNEGDVHIIASLLAIQVLEYKREGKPDYAMMALRLRERITGIFDQSRDEETCLCEESENGICNMCGEEIDFLARVYEGER